MVFLGPGSWKTAAFLFVCGNLGFGCANVFYESLLPRLVPRERLDAVSARGYALGYVGGGLLLVINLFWVMKPELFGIPDAGFAVRLSLLSAALWWGFFAVPLVRNFPASDGAGAERGAWTSGWRSIAATVRAARHHRQLALFLLAFWLYNDGIGTIVKMATAYGDEIGIGLNDMVLALVITQFVGIPCSLLFGELGNRWGARRALLLSLGVYVLISVGGYFMQTAVHFYALALAVGTVQGGAQALSRSIYAAMVPRGKEAQFFGFYSTSARFAGIVGPLVFGLVGQLTGTSRISILSVSAFLVLGGLLLTRVNVDRGVREAHGEAS
jgi:UMF1 family MFS transporter